MCGFTAYLHSASVPKNRDGQFPVLDLEDSLTLIHHRGPDGRGTYYSPDGRCGLGHVRLSIIDLEGGQQPLHSQCGKIHAVVNGELYDHDRLTQELQEKGHQFKSHSDSEMAIHFYEDYDTDFVDHLRGEFAVAIWDERKGRLLVVRDRYGIKPVYYTTINGTFMAASEIKAFLAFGWKPEWDIDSIVHHGAASDHRTCFKGVYKLPPAHYLTVSSSGSVAIKEYWDLEFGNKDEEDRRTVEEMIEGVRGRLIESIRLRLRADVPIGIFLSGGLDSSSIAGVATHLLKQNDPKAKLDAFSVSFTGGQEYDEGEIAERTAAFCGANFHKLCVTSQDMMDNFADTIWHVEQPIFMLSSVAQYFLAKHCHEAGIKVILTGQGSDEHFLGYEYLHHAYLLSPDNATPGGFGKPTEDTRKKLLKEYSGNQIVMGHPIDTVKKSTTAHRLNNVVMQDGYNGMLNCPPDMYLDHALQNGTPDSGSAMLEAVSGVARYKARKYWHPVHASLYLGNRIFLPNILLNHYGDRIELASALEGRPPYLDHELCQYVNSLPPSVKLRGDGEKLNEKWILKEAMKPFITEEIYKRTKRPFVAPPVALTAEKATPYKTIIDKHLSKEKVDRLGWAKWSFIEKQRDHFLETADKNSAKVMLIIISYIIIGETFGVATATP